MIFTVLNKHSRQHLGVVNEPTIRAAMESARERFGRKWHHATQSWVEIVSVDVEPGETQYGMDLGWDVADIARMQG